MKLLRLLLLTIILTLPIFSVSSQAQVTKYVKPDAAKNGDGSISNPYNDIAKAVNVVARDPKGGDVVIIDGTYDFRSTSNNGIIRISTKAKKNAQVVIRPQTEGEVILKFDGRTGFEFTEDSSWITVDGLDLYGQTDQVYYWDIVAKSFWEPQATGMKGGLAVKVDGQHITIKNNHIHDWYQKAVEIKDGRYVNVEGNIIHDIATTSLSGGHGIMRQQKGKEFKDDDDPNYYRWDISENLLYRVEQRIYSWVPSKGYITMVIDEGKSILIDDPKDTDNHQEEMKARIRNNVVAYGSVDAIRLKSTPNLEVTNNSVYQVGPDADGITDKKGDTNTPKFINFVCKNNAVQTVTNVFAVNIKTAVTQGSSSISVSDNVAMDGKVQTYGKSGVIEKSGGQLFIDPANGDFRINSSLGGLPSNLGVETTVLESIADKATLFGANVGSSSFVVDHLRLTQTILDNIPGINDGVDGNEKVFKDSGIMNLDAKYPNITYRVYNGYWKKKRKSPNKQEFRLNKVYYTWYRDIERNFKNESGEKYKRICWGASEIMQNHVFPHEWLTVSQIKSTSDYTQINGYDNKLTLDGDLLIEFKNFTPKEGDEFDLMVAKSIVASSNNSGKLFNRVIFKGLAVQPEDYTLEIVEKSSNVKALRLKIKSALAIDDEINFSRLKVSPNPSQGSFFIESDNEIENIRMFDMQGRDITSCLNIIRIDRGYNVKTNNIKSGLYIIKANNFSTRVVIK